MSVFKSRYSQIFFSVVLLLLTACSGRHGTVEITVVSTGDIHGRVYDTDYLTGNKRNGSMVQAASLVSQLRSQKKDLLYFDTGDIFIGTGESYYDMTSDFGNPSLLAAMLDVMGCNGFVPGNHEFDLGIPTLDRFITSGEFPVVCANMVYDANGECYFPPYTIIEKSGVKIAVIGFTTKSISYKIPWELIDGLTVTSVVESANKWIPYIQETEKPDLIFALVHSGLTNGFDDGNVCENEVFDLAEQVGGIDLILYGHDHQEYCQKVVGYEGDSILLVNPGCHAKNAAVTTLELDFKKKELVGKRISSQLVPLKDIEPDKEFVDLLEPRRVEYVNYLDSILGTASTDITYDGYPYQQTLAMDYIHNILQRSMSSEVTLTLSVRGNDISKGDVTLREAISFYPYENTLVSMMLYGREIDAAMEESFKYYRFRPSDIITAGGIDYKVDVSKPVGDRVEILSMSDGKPFVEKRLYRVTMDSYLAYSLGSPFIESLKISREKLKERLITTTRSDIRYHVITDFAVKKENGKSVQPVRNGEWNVVNYN